MYTGDNVDSPRMTKMITDRTIKQTWLLVAMLFTASTTTAADVTFAVASNFALPMKELVKQFNSAEGAQSADHNIRIALNSSGKLFAQITHRAPYSAFFSADQSKPKKLVSMGLAVEDSLFTYATGQLALWSRTDNLFQNNDSYLRSGEFHKLAIANPKLAPYGLAAEQTLHSLQLFDNVRPKLVKGENVSQAYQYTFTGNADIGFVALSQITSNGKVTTGSAWKVPANLHQPIHQDAVILSNLSAEAKQLTETFFRFMKSTQARAIIKQYGYRED